MVWKLWKTHLDICHCTELLISWIFVMVRKMWTTYLDICHGTEAVDDILGYLAWYGSCGRHTRTCHGTAAVDILDICHGTVAVDILDICYGMEAVDDILFHLSFIVW
jgi:hypothetical protein